jgi:hypothetical protein
MRAEYRKLNVPTSVAVGLSMDVGHLLNKAIQISGTFVATIQLQVSLNGDDYVSLGSAYTAGALVQVTETFRYIRANVTAYTSGAPVITIGGFHARTDG